ncbi:MAG TPA: hypothetical protein VJ843_05755 [Candidatus Saccharimonadales bacterium]|nr:hypothetical protein [Candidatus Saccharimonadales bacterium]
MTQLNELMDKEMSRKEFLTTVGFGIASVMGLSTILKLLTGKKANQQVSSYGYGGGAYGGTKRG